MKKADISTFENVAKHSGGYINVSNAKPVRNVGTLSGALGLVSGLPTLSKVGKLTKGDKFQKVAQKVLDTANQVARPAFFFKLVCDVSFKAHGKGSVVDDLKAFLFYSLDDYFFFGQVDALSLNVKSQF